MLLKAGGLSEAETHPTVVKSLGDSLILISVPLTLELSL